MHNRSSMVAVQGPVLWPTLAYLINLMGGVVFLRRVGVLEGMLNIQYLAFIFHIYLTNFRTV
jgi:hypothetical protein